MDYRTLVCGCLLYAALCLPLQAAVYTWTDENGRVHFSDRPVDEAAKELNVHTGPAKGSSGRSIPQDRTERRQRMLDAYERERAEKREAAQKAKDAREKRKRQCFNARARYDEYRSVGGIYKYLESGEREYYSKEQRDRYIAGLKADVGRYCD